MPFTEKFLTSKYVNWLNDPEVVRYSRHRFQSHTIKSCEKYYQSYLETPNYLWAIVVRDSEHGHIGNMNAYVDVNNSVADIGILIGEKKVWGRGYGKEAWVAACDFLLRIEEFRKVTAGTLSVNTAMLKIMQYAGMVEDGRRIRHHTFEGQEVDLMNKALFREDWNSRAAEFQHILKNLITLLFNIYVSHI